MATERTNTGERVNDGGQAFPDKLNWGMSLRQWYASMAIQGIVSRGVNMTSDFLIGDAVKLAFKVADAMIEFEKAEQP